MRTKRALVNLPFTTQLITQQTITSCTITTMVTPFKLSRELHGHSQDVRSVTVLPSGHIATGSRDNTIKIWDPLDPSKSKTLTAHQNFVACLTPLTPTSEQPTRIFASGGNDKVICVWDATVDSIDDGNNNNNNNNNDANNDSDNPINYMIGHENTVSTLSTTVEGDIISGSWDKTARVWRHGQCVQELKGHEHAVWAVLGLPNGDIVTASADSTIKIWRGALGSMTCVRTLQGHTDCVRGLALVPGVGFVSCSNDETLRLWSMQGDHLQTLYGHTAFVYTVGVLSLSESNHLIISGSEDRTLKIWKDGECAQTITHPSGVWCVSASAHGDIASACADGVARTWTQDALRIASDDALRAFDESVASASVHKSAIGDLNLDKLPGMDALSEKRGTKDGEHLIVKTSSGGAELHSWSMADQKWVKIGDVVESANGSSSKQSLHGKEYDYVFDIDVGDGMTLKLGYNSGENPYLVAQEFLWKEELDQGFLDQVAQFIIKNANVSAMTLGGPAPASDPLTGGNRYVPGSNPASKSASAGGDAFTGKNRYVPYASPNATSSAPTPATATATNASSVSNNYFPQLTMTSYDGGNLAGLVQKLTEFNSVVPNPLTPEEQGHLTALTNTLKDTSRYHSTRVTEEQLRVVIKKLLAWPTANLLPVLDLVRLLFTHSHAAELLGAIRTTPSLFEILYTIAADITTPTNSMLALRAIANMFKNSGARRIIEANQAQIMDLLIITVGSDNKNVTHASATILMNFSVMYRQQVNETSVQRAIAAIAKGLETQGLAQDVALRYVIAAGTLAQIPIAFAHARAQLSALIPALAASQDKDLGPAARALAQILV